MSRTAVTTTANLLPDELWGLIEPLLPPETQYAVGFQGSTLVFADS